MQMTTTWQLTEKKGDNVISGHKLAAENKPTQFRLMDSGTCIHMFLCQLLEVLQHPCSVDVNLKIHKVNNISSA